MSPARHDATPHTATRTQTGVTDPGEAPASGPLPAGRRDPAARRRAIVEAAAELAGEVGTARLTHRLVAQRAGVALGSTTQYFASIDELRDAAVMQLAEQADASIAEAIEALSDPATAPERFAKVTHDFLCDTRQVRAEMAIITSGVTDPRLRELSRRWYDAIVPALTRLVGPDRAIYAAVFFDGAVMHAASHDTPLSEAQLAEALRAFGGSTRNDT